MGEGQHNNPRQLGLPSAPKPRVPLSKRIRICWFASGVSVAAEHHRPKASIGPVLPKRAASVHELDAQESKESRNEENC